MFRRQYAAYKFDGVLRYIAGINSRGDIISRSLLTTVALPDILNFIKDEGGKLNLKVCGSILTHPNVGADQCGVVCNTASRSC